MVLEKLKDIVTRIFSFYRILPEKLEKYLVLLTVAFFLGGIFLAKFWNGFGEAVNNGASAFIEFYGYIAPLAIFVILSPALAKLLSSNAGKFGAYAVSWLAIRRLLACIWAVIFTVIIFKFPIFPEGNVSIMAAVTKSVQTVIKMMYSSPFMIAIWIGIITAFVSLKIKWIFKILDKIATGFENAGQHFISLVPLFMMAIGAYIYSLPNSINAQIGLEEQFTFSTVNILGINLNPNTISGMILIYFIGALLVGVACFIWHFVLLAITKYKIRTFSIKNYFKDYWVKVYPLLWATSSEALATPLNLYLTKKYFPNVKKVVRRFVVGMGSYLNINGTLICVFVLGGVVTSALGLKPSLVEWLLAVPIIFLLGYGVPGIPGELILFAAPIALLLNLPIAIVPVFLALYLGLQLGLPDSFRTGNNSTDNCVCAVLLNDVYEKNFLKTSKDVAAQDFDIVESNKVVEPHIKELTNGKLKAKVIRGGD